MASSDEARSERFHMIEAEIHIWRSVYNMRVLGPMCRTRHDRQISHLTDCDSPANTSRQR